MARMSDLIGVNLQWVQPKASKQEYELYAADLVVCRLHVHSSFSSMATASSAEGTWTFNRPGFWQQKALVLESGSERELGVFQRYSLRNNGRLMLPDGRIFLTTCNFWGTRYGIQDEMENDLVSYFNIRGFFRSACDVEIHPLAGSLAELSWLVPFGWYLELMMKRDTAAAAAAS